MAGSFYGQHLVYLAQSIQTFPLKMSLENGEKILHPPKNWQQRNHEYPEHLWRDVTAWGMCTGQVLKDKWLTVIDIDTKETIQYMIEIGAPDDAIVQPTRMVETPRRGGLHILCYTPFAVKSAAHIPLNGQPSKIDLRGEGGFVIAHGSCFANVPIETMEYKLINPQDPIADVHPFWIPILQNFMVTPCADSATSPLANNGVEIPFVLMGEALVSEQGKLETLILTGGMADFDKGRDRSAHDFGITCCALRCGKTDSEITEILLKQPKAVEQCKKNNRHNAELYISHTIKKARVQVQKDARKSVPVAAVIKQEPLAVDFNPTLTDSTSSSDLDSALNMLFTKLQTTNPEQKIEYLIPGPSLIPRQSVTILGGGSHVGKSSLLVGSMLIPMCKGDLVFKNFQMPKVRTFYLQSDMAGIVFKDKILDRFGYEISSMGSDLTFFHYHDNTIRKDVSTTIGFINSAVDRGYELIVIDNRTTLFTDSVFGQNSQADSLKIVAALKQIAIDRNIAIILVEHVTKMQHKPWEPITLDDIYGAGIKSADQVIGLCKYYREVYKNGPKGGKIIVEQPKPIAGMGCMVGLKSVYGTNFTYRCLVNNGMHDYSFDRYDGTLQSLTIEEKAAEDSYFELVNKDQLDKAKKWLDNQQGQFKRADMVNAIDISFDLAAYIFDKWIDNGNIENVNPGGIDRGSEIIYKKGQIAGSSVPITLIE